MQHCIDLEYLLSFCALDQRALFERCYPDGVPDKDRDSAIALIERTIKANDEKAKKS